MVSILDSQGCICNHEYTMLSDATLLTPTRCIALRARRFSRLVSRRFEHALRETGLTPAQFSLLGAVMMKQPVSPIALARMIDLEKSTLSRNLRPLIGSKLLASESRKEGGQSLSISVKGRELFRQAIPAWRTAQAEVIALVGKDIVSQLDVMIAKMGKG